MAPKPFPYPLGIGTDICHIHRIHCLMQNESTVNRWLRKVSSRLEWPYLVRKFNMSLDSPTSLPANDVDLNLKLPHVWEREPVKADWLQNPRMTGTSSEPERLRLKVGTRNLAQFLAGRSPSRQILFSGTINLPSRTHSDGRQKKPQSKLIDIDILDHGIYQL